MLKCSDKPGLRSEARVFKILGADNRIRIIELLKQGSKGVNAIARKLGISQSAVSQHLRVLKAMGLVEDRRRGYWIDYILVPEALERCRQETTAVCCCLPATRPVRAHQSKKELQDYREQLKRELARVEKRLKELEPE